MNQQKLREIRTLIVRLGILTVIGVVGYLAYRWFGPDEASDEIVLQDSPLKVEQIRSILELNTLKFQDEVVVDSVEFYNSTSDQIAGNLNKIIDVDQFKHGISGSAVKRRLTLIIKGELLYGVDLKRRDFQMLPQGDSLIIVIPTPELLSIAVSPKKTEIVTENGYWKDYEIGALERNAKEKMKLSGERLRLVERAKEPLEKCLTGLIKTDKTIVIRYQ